MTNSKIKIRMIRSAQSNQEQPSLFFDSWAEGSEIKDKNGRSMPVYHGTTHDFDEFSMDNRQNSRGNYFGKGFYFTNNKDDAWTNYAGIGPDLKSRINDRTERLYLQFEMGYENDPDAYSDLPFIDENGQWDEDEAWNYFKAEAEKFLIGNRGESGTVMENYLRMKNPVVLEPHGGTKFQFDEVYDDDGELIDDESGSAWELYQAIMDTARSYSFSGQPLWDDLATHYDFRDGVTAWDVNVALRNNGVLANELESVDTNFTDDDDTDSSLEEIGPFIAKVFQHMGFDGTDLNAWHAFGGGKKNGGMAGIGRDTRHYVVWEPTAVKSTSNTGIYDPENPKITANSTINRLVRVASQVDRENQNLGDFLDGILSTMMRLSQGRLTYPIQGFEQYSESDMLGWIRGDIESKMEYANIDIDIVSLKFYGSRAAYRAGEDSDLDVIMEYIGDEREDGLFDFLNDDDDPIELRSANGEMIRVDINPIQVDGKGNMMRHSPSSYQEWMQPVQDFRSNYVPEVPEESAPRLASVQEDFSPENVDLDAPFTQGELESLEFALNDAEREEILEDIKRHRIQKARRLWERKQQHQKLKSIDWVKAATDLYGTNIEPWVDDSGSLDLGHDHTTSHWMLPDGKLTRQFQDHYKSAQELEQGALGGAKIGAGLGDKFTNHPNMYFMGQYGNMARMRNVPTTKYGGQPELWMAFYNRPTEQQMRWLRKHGSQIERNGGGVRFDIFHNLSSTPKASASSMREFHQIPWDEIYASPLSED